MELIGCNIPNDKGVLIAGLGDCDVLDCTELSIVKVDCDASVRLVSIVVTGLELGADP